MLSPLPVHCLILITFSFTCLASYDLLSIYLYLFLSFLYPWWVVEDTSRTWSDTRLITYAWPHCYTRASVGRIRQWIMTLLLALGHCIRHAHIHGHSIPSIYTGHQRWTIHNWNRNWNWNILIITLILSHSAHVLFCI